MGGMTMDIMMRLPYFPAPGETVKTDNVTFNPGGKTSNQAATIAKLGGSVRYLTKLGGDENSKVLTSIFKDYGIDMDYVLYDPSLMAGIAMVQVNQDGQNACSFFPGACLQLTKEEVLKQKKAFEGCAVLLISMELQPDTVIQALSLAKENAMITILDPSPMPAQGIPPDISKLVDYVKPNETETSALTGLKIDSLTDAKLGLEVLKQQGYRFPIISMGENGSMFYVNGIATHLPAFKVKSIDTTAAGDVFLGSLTLCLSQGKDILECAEFASAAAALCTTRAGAQTSIPSINEILNLQQHQVY